MCHSVELVSFHGAVSRGVFSLAEGLDNSSPLAQKSADGMSRFSRAKALQSCEANFREGGLRTTPDSATWM
jgi:hypothetical protein